MSDTVSYTFRMPSDLKRLMESAAKSGGVSLPSSITDACWKYLEIDGGNETEPHSRMPNLAPASKPDIAALKAICAGTAKLEENYGQVIADAIMGTPCPKQGFNEQDGETYRCSLLKGHKGNCKPGERV